MGLKGSEIIQNASVFQESPKGRLAGMFPY